MAVQDQDHPVPRTLGLRLLASNIFAFGLGGVLWSALVFVVVHSPV